MKGLRVNTALFVPNDALVLGPVPKMGHGPPINKSIRDFNLGRREHVAILFFP